MLSLKQTPMQTIEPRYDEYIINSNGLVFSEKVNKKLKPVITDIRIYHEFT